MSTVRSMGALLSATMALALVPTAGVANDPFPSLPVPAPGADRIRLLAPDWFLLSPDVFLGFERQTGVAIEVVPVREGEDIVDAAVDADGALRADVVFGVDSLDLARATSGGRFAAYRPAALADVPAELQQDPDGRLTPIDRGEVCLNLDLEAFDGPDEPVLPTSLDQLADPAYRDMLVVADPRTDREGLRFLLATIARFGDEGPTTWRDWWRSMRENRVLVMADWYDAYFGAFSGARSRGDRPLIPSSAAGPVSEMQFMEPRPASPPIGVLLDGCQRDVTFAGVLAGTERSELAQALIDFLLSPEVQSDLPTWVLRAPVRASVPLTAEWLAWAAAPESPSLLDPTITQVQRDAWVAEWAAIVTP